MGLATVDRVASAGNRPAPVYRRDPCGPSCALAPAARCRRGGRSARSSRGDGPSRAGSLAGSGLRASARGCVRVATASIRSSPRFRVRPPRAPRRPWPLFVRSTIVQTARPRVGDSHAASRALAAKSHRMESRTSVRRHRSRPSRPLDQLAAQDPRDRTRRARTAHDRTCVAYRAVGFVLSRDAELAMPPAGLPLRGRRSVRLHGQGRDRRIHRAVCRVVLTTALRGRYGDESRARRGRSQFRRTHDRGRHRVRSSRRGDRRLSRGDVAAHGGAYARRRIAVALVAV